MNFILCALKRVPFSYILSHVRKGYPFKITTQKKGYPKGTLFKNVKRVSTQSTNPRLKNPEWRILKKPSTLGHYRDPPPKN